MGTLQKNGIENGDLFQVTIFLRAKTKSKAQVFKKLINKERRYVVYIRPQTGWIALVIKTDPLKVDFDTIKEMIIWHISKGADHDCKFLSWRVTVPFKGNRKTPQTIKNLVDSQLILIPCPKRKETLQNILIAPREKVRTGMCVAEDKASGTIIVYDIFMRHGPDYPWGVLDRGNYSDVDCLWHASLDDALINSNLCSESLIPEDYEIP